MNLRATLQTLRSQIALYKLQHRDAWPDLVSFPDWQPLVQATDEQGRPIGAGLAPSRAMGPYIQAPIPNALNGFTKVEPARGKPPLGYRPEGKDVGYLFDPDAGRLYATSSDGGVFAE